MIRQANAGKAAALNTDIAHARHELVVMMDGDTVFEPGTVRRLGAYETPIDKMLSLPPQRATLELVPDQGAEPRPDGL